jgi:hypothetical protein
MSKKIFIVLLSFLNLAIAQDQTLDLGTPPKELPEYDTAAVKLSWNEIVKEHYGYFANHYIYAKGGSKRDTIMTIRNATMAIFGGIYGWQKSGFWKSYDKIVKPFYKSRTVQRALYDWIKSEYWEAYLNLPDWKKKIYKDMLIHAKEYVSSFDYDIELKILEESERFFIYNGPNGRRGDYRRMEAFIFRRVHKKEMTIQEISYWISVLEKDLTALEK